VIPYFRPPNLELGPITLEPFGILTAVGVLVGALLASRAAKLQGKDTQVLETMAMWALAGGLMGGHLVHLFLYHPEELQKSPWQILKFWDGLSSMGGLLGGVIAGKIYFWRKKIAGVREYGDALALGLAPGWGIARVGCFTVHDHPGVPTDFFLAVDFPAWALPGGPRHDLGLYEALLLFTLAAILWTLFRKGALKGALLPLLAIGYGIPRFFFDFLRATDLPYVDARYLGLTPAQYMVVVLVAWGVGALVVRSRRGQLNWRAGGA
jgi:phosphatidylglycerol---prolipoprotein diacylglyceryl transferase